ncbi:membrane protein [Rufibacter radiotolerans]|uniref:Membrane protein n=1 Tax=Rufibacter radiotolerans TaxID=1379910 RepID=A0A0H4W348_9BACT|nr:YoaK family protein [Rufibacter radiotolerans]AKQ44871.1 membrane protein [Rufibacter radiotolerans]
MFRHRGKSRTFTHNLKLASLLSFVAGIVNVSGLFAVQRLTTHVTGHFAFFADELVKKNYGQGLVYLLFILAFFLGAFCSNLIIELISRRDDRFINSIPVGIEILLLSFVAFLDPPTILAQVNTVACLLLFAMGLQNALVTSISNSIVRTTHLTGLFTDLGIELSQLFFYKRKDQQKKLRSSIKLRLTIIFFFFFGGVTGGYGYLLIGIKILLLTVCLLTSALIYDSIKFKIVSIKRKYLR